MQLWPAFMHIFPAAMGCDREQCMMCSERSSEPLVRRLPQQNFLAFQVSQQKSPGVLLFAYVCQLIPNGLAPWDVICNHACVLEHTKARIFH